MRIKHELFWTCFRLISRRRCAAERQLGLISLTDASYSVLKFFGGGLNRPNLLDHTYLYEVRAGSHYNRLLNENALNLLVKET